MALGSMLDQFKRYGGSVLFASSRLKYFRFASNGFEEAMTTSFGNKGDATSCRGDETFDPVCSGSVAPTSRQGEPDRRGVAYTQPTSR